MIAKTTADRIIDKELRKLKVPTDAKAIESLQRVKAQIDSLHQTELVADELQVVLSNGRYAGVNTLAEARKMKDHFDEQDIDSRIERVRTYRMVEVIEYE